MTFLQNTYDPSKPTLYNVGTGKYMNEINVHDKKGRIVGALVDQLVENRTRAYNDRFDMFEGERRMAAFSAEHNLQDGKAPIHLIEYHGMSEGVFDEFEWRHNVDPRVHGEIRTGIMGMYDRMAHWMYDHFHYKIVWFLKSCGWAVLGCSILALGIFEIIPILLAAIVGGACGAPAFIWFMLVFLPD